MGDYTELDSKRTGPMRHIYRILENKVTQTSLVEFIGTFFLTLTIGLVASGAEGKGASALIPLAIGSALMVLIFMTGHLSGGHLNPSVTLGVVLRRAMSWNRAIAYVGAQLIGGLVGAATALGLCGIPLAFQPQMKSATETFTVGQAFFAELIYTFLLMSVVLNVATTKTQKDNSFFGLAIGFTVFVAAESVGFISGGGFNPAVATGCSIVCAAHSGGNACGIHHLWLYWLGPLMGSALAALVFRITNQDEFTDKQVLEHYHAKDKRLDPSGQVVGRDVSQVQLETAPGTISEDSPLNRGV